MTNERMVRVFAQTETPVSPQAGDLWANPSSTTKVHNGTTWVSVQQSATVADLTAQTITIGPALLTGAGDGATTQTALTNLTNKMNEVLGALRTAGVVST